ncbi:hypothetical protein AUK11_03715 [bacterium CG2_30_37_16]|nr:MAG: hypothetical protein AUK11_03715 [bacterium CG2_30_37_16]PIP31126.1 MAG: hypothetical protein COX25_01015 [bacterium (Candidatus Howlettbacteria) CG23_combo_of_CG06-09_8_20_14_all_37_9]PIY00243.1 MAG: hypothetical protein COZ22_00695 [bacterium (Candidatus Howlettbacteria) CG_4_10_14_3_um_filter_37_10]PJB06057.1 MAG: hypothetical protein CO123_02855 [bacterium (Candidatus Howlettbacteria) CG_4_9_14_3_um_filter_37_10]
MDPENKNLDSLAKNVDSIKPGNASVPPSNAGASPISNLGDNLQIIKTEPEVSETPVASMEIGSTDMSSVVNETPTSVPDINTANITAGAQVIPPKNSVDNLSGQASPGPSTDSISASPQPSSQIPVSPITSPQTPAASSPDWGTAAKPAAPTSDFFGNQGGTDLPELPKKKSGVKKLLIIGAVLLILLPSIGFAAYFGYNKYLVPTPKKVLNAAAKTMQEMSPFTSDIILDISTSGLKYSINGTLSVDKNKSFDLKFIVPPSTSLNMLYLNKDDKFYLNDFTNLETKNNLIEYSNPKKYLAKYEKDMGKAIKTPTSLDFTDEDLKYIKKEKSEVISGVKTTKYSFNPTKEYIEKNIPTKDLGIDADKIKMTLNLWIGNKDSKLYKIDLNLKAAMPSSSSSALGSIVKGGPSEFEINFVETFKYGFNNTIALPAGAKIVQKIDLSKDDPFSALTGVSASLTSMSDKKVMNAIHQIATEEADLYDTNNAYSDADGSGTTTLDPLIKQITDTAGSATPARDVIQLNLIANGYTASAQLVSDATRYFCVDSTGFADYVDTAPIGELCSPE